MKNQMTNKKSSFKLSGDDGPYLRLTFYYLQVVTLFNTGFALKSQRYKKSLN